MTKALVLVFWLIGVAALWPTRGVRGREGVGTGKPGIFGYDLRASFTLERRGSPRVCAAPIDTVYVIMPSGRWSVR